MYAKHVVAWFELSQQQGNQLNEAATNFIYSRFPKETFWGRLKYFCNEPGGGWESLDIKIHSPGIKNESQQIIAGFVVAITMVIPFIIFLFISSK